MRSSGRVVLHGWAVALAIGAPGTVMAQARLAPSNPQQARCIEAFAETQQEKTIREKIGEPPQEALDEFVDRDKAESLYAWATKRAIAVFGSEEAARAANEKMRIEKYTRRFEPLRKNAREGHLPSLQLLASHYWGKEVQDIPGLPTPEERSAAYRTLHDHRLPLAAGALAAECREALREMSESSATKEKLPELVDGQIQKYGTDEIIEDDPDALDAHEKAREAREAREARRLTEIAIKREACVNLWREAGFRGETYAWETLADHYNTYYSNYSTYHSDKAPPPQAGIVPPVELYAWLELDKLTWREQKWEDQYNVPRMHQDDLVKDVMDEEHRRDARALAEKYAQIIWPRCIARGGEGVCRLIPQFAGDPEPYGSDPSPR